MVAGIKVAKQKQKRQNDDMSSRMKSATVISQKCLDPGGNFKMLVLQDYWELDKFLEILFDLCNIVWLVSEI